jgi:hypothetical protein
MLTSPPLKMETRERAENGRVVGFSCASFSGRGGDKKEGRGREKRRVEERRDQE